MGVVFAALLLALALAGLLISNNVLPAIVAVLVGFAVAGFARVVRPAVDTRGLFSILALAFGLRVLLATSVYLISLALGRGGFLTGDDISYASLAWHFVEYLRGEAVPPHVPPSWAGEHYLFGTYVYLSSAVFYLIGPQVLAMQIINAGFATATLVLFADLVARLFGPRAALFGTSLFAAYPSIALWSSLNLKESLAIFIAIFVVWLLKRLQTAPRAWQLLTIFAALLALDSMRRYLVVTLLLAVLIGVFFVPRRWFLPKMRWVASTALLSAGLLLLTGTAQSLLLPPDKTLGTFEHVRLAMTVGARTGFAAPWLVGAPAGAPGDVISGRAPLFAVATTVPTSAPTSVPTSVPTTGPTTVPTSRPTTVPVTVRTSAGTLRTTAPTSVPTTAPTTVPTSVPTSVPTAVPTTRATMVPLEVPTPAEATGEENIAMRTLIYLPTGLAYALFAPFPWSAQSTADLLAVPEMLTWYAIVGMAMATILRASLARSFAVPVLVYVACVLLIFALAQGNIGTLFRHRSMVIPFVILLASPAIVLAYDFVSSRVDRKFSHASRVADPRPH